MPGREANYNASLSRSSPVWSAPWHWHSTGRSFLYIPTAPDWGQLSHGALEFEIPRLERTDGKPIKDDELKRYGFNITIDSVSYDTPVDRDTIRCAVLLNINFDVADAVLAYAVVPLTTGTKYEHISTEGNYDEDRIRISGHLPENTEWVQTRRLIGTKDALATPNLSFSALGNSASLSGIGVHKHFQVDDPIMISLRPMMKTLSGRPIQLNWEFENKDGPFYPPSLRVLVVVEKRKEFPDEVFFPFVLKLRKELRIKVRGVKHHFRWAPQIFNKNSDGWSFRIKGNFKPVLAKTALKDAAQPTETMKVVGLRAATNDWFKAQQTSA